jgi:hypothetical protein
VTVTVAGTIVVGAGNDWDSATARTLGSEQLEVSDGLCKGCGAAVGGGAGEIVGMGLGYASTAIDCIAEFTSPGCLLGIVGGRARSPGR